MIFDKPAPYASLLRSCSGAVEVYHAVYLPWFGTELSHLRPGILNHQADVAFAVVIGAPPARTKPHPNGSLSSMKEAKGGSTRCFRAAILEERHQG
jgi:hypothetical protein